MRIRKNKKRIDPRYFLHETVLRENEEKLIAALRDIYDRADRLEAPHVEVLRGFNDMAPNYPDILTPEEHAYIQTQLDAIINYQGAKEAHRPGRPDPDQASAERAAKELKTAIGGKLNGYSI